MIEERRRTGDVSESMRRKKGIGWVEFLVIHREYVVGGAGMGWVGESGGRASEEGERGWGWEGDGRSSYCKVGEEDCHFLPPKGISLI